MSPSRATSKKSKSALSSSLFTMGLLLFTITQAIGLYVASVFLQSNVIAAEAASSTVPTFLITFIVATIVMLLIIKYTKGGFLFKGLLAFLIFAGSQTVFTIFMPTTLSVVLAAALVILRFTYPTVLVQNLTLVLAMAGVSASLGLLFTLPAVLIILAILSVYDVIAVYKTKHMISLFTGMMDRGVPFSLIIPSTAQGVHTRVNKATPGTGKYMMLGTGDIAFPLVFATSALRYSLLAAIAVVFGAVLGLAAIHLLFLRKGRGAIPALPAMLFFSVILFTLTLFFGGA